MNVEDKEIQEIISYLETLSLEAAYGRAVLAASSLEQTLYLLSVTRLHETIKKDKEIFLKEIEKLKRLTLGPLIEHVISEFEISEYWQEELDNMLFFRNMLAHQAFEAMTSYFLQHGSKQNVIEELEQ